MTHVTCRLTARDRDQRRNPIRSVIEYGLNFLCPQNGYPNVTSLHPVQDPQPAYGIYAICGQFRSCTWPIRVSNSRGPESSWTEVGSPQAADGSPSIMSRLVFIARGVILKEPRAAESETRLPANVRPVPCPFFPHVYGTKVCRELFFKNK